MNMRVFMVFWFLYLGVVAHATCPVNLDYVTNLSWDTSYCRSLQTESEIYLCRTTLRTVFGIGLSQYLRENSTFELPNNSSATSCLENFQEKLTSLGLQSNLVRLCFNDTSEFVSSPSLCAGIQTKQDWIQKVGSTSLDTACKDVSTDSACDTCFESGNNVLQNKLLDMIDNVTADTSRKCYYFICLYAAGVVNELGPYNKASAACILRVPFLQENSSPRKVLFYSLISVAVGLICLCGLGLGYVLWSRANGLANHKRYVRMSKLRLTGALKLNTGAVWYSVNEIKSATDNFSDENVIGQGGFGTVYKGVVSDGREIAVKSIRDVSSEGDAEFINEVEIIDKIRHRNLVVLRGFCVASDDTEGRRRFLIYDYMANGSLDEHLHGGGKKEMAVLSWDQRKNISIGTAKGLAYLHFGVQPAIYHRDIKATNILLDDEMNACVADFGLARMTVEGESHLTTRIAGTHGYLAPEYALYGQLTDRSDVYSFGVVLLEIMSGRKALDSSVEMASDYLITDWAWKLVKEGKTLQVIDRRIRDSAPHSIMERFVLVGILCAHVMVAFRPSIVEALKMLEGDAEIPPIRDRPLPLASQKHLVDEYSSISSQSQSVFQTSSNCVVKVIPR